AELYREIGVGFQQGGLLGRLSVAENLMFAMEKVRGWHKEEQAARVDRYLHRVNLWHARGLYPHQISGGMKRRLSIARALCTEPKLILLDNPTAGLDPISSRQLLKMFDFVMGLDRETSVICFTSYVEVGTRMANRSIFLHESRFIFDGIWRDIFVLDHSFVKEVFMLKFSTYPPDILAKLNIPMAAIQEYQQQEMVKKPS
ncbi:MAG: ATP-binding cassette domain-containing protein, partial [Proteobacteria bacterium]|nr:ATP-binding cassette domain-containing protein [Pseudomonadota bacterium]